MPGSIKNRKGVDMKTNVKLASLTLVAALALGACASNMMEQKSLYDRLGGKPAISAVVDDFIGNVAADNRINGRFAKADIPHLKMRLVEQISAGTGGPVAYNGLPMKAAHTGMHITDAEFGDLVEDLVKSLDKFHVPEKEKGELLGILGPMKSDIVGQ